MSFWTKNNYQKGYIYIELSCYLDNNSNKKGKYMSKILINT